MRIHKLGKLPPRIDHRTMKFSRYRTASPLPTIHEASWITHVRDPWPMALNDSLGDCTIAAAVHMIQQWTTYTGSPFIVPDSATLKAYEDVGGYVPGDPSTDQGCVMLDVLNYWRKTGIGGHFINSFVSVDFTNYQEVLDAIYLFGNVYVGIQLPLNVQGFNSWTVGDGGPSATNNTPGSWGGHCIPCMADSIHSKTVITWGEVLKMSPNFWTDYVDECWAVLSLDWLSATTNLSPGNFNLNALQQDLALL